MKNAFCLALLTFALVCQTAANAQIDSPTASRPPVTEKRQKELLDWYVKYIFNPKISYMAKSAAFDVVAGNLSQFRLNEAFKAGFLQNNEAIGQESFNGLFNDEPSNPYKDSNLRFVAEHITQVPAEVQVGVLYDLSAGVGVQTSEREAIFHSMAKRVAQRQLQKQRMLNLADSNALSGACFMLALSPLYDADDEKLLVDSVAFSISPVYLAQALSYRKVLTSDRLKQLELNSKGNYDFSVAMQVVAAEVDESARKALVEKITQIARKKYPPTRDIKTGAIDLSPQVDGTYITALRFINIPEKEGLLRMASQSNQTIIRVAAIFTAMESYPEWVFNLKSLKAAFQGNDFIDPLQYQELVTQLALRHRSYVARAQQELTPKIFNENVRKIRDIVYVFDIGATGFNGG